jgi:hypothetical protein
VGNAYTRTKFSNVTADLNNVKANVIGNIADQIDKVLLLDRYESPNMARQERLVNLNDTDPATFYNVMDVADAKLNINGYDALNDIRISSYEGINKFIGNVFGLYFYNSRNVFYDRVIIDELVQKWGNPSYNESITEDFRFAMSSITASNYGIHITNMVIATMAVAGMALFKTRKPKDLQREANNTTGGGGGRSAEEQLRKQLGIEPSSRSMGISLSTITMATIQGHKLWNTALLLESYGNAAYILSRYINHMCGNIFTVKTATDVMSFFRSWDLFAGLENGYRLIVVLVTIAIAGYGEIHARTHGLKEGVIIPTTKFLYKSLKGCFGYLYSSLKILFTFLPNRFGSYVREYIQKNVPKEQQEAYWTEFWNEMTEEEKQFLTVQGKSLGLVIQEDSYDLFPTLLYYLVSHSVSTVQNLILSYGFGIASGVPLYMIKGANVSTEAQIHRATLSWVKSSPNGLLKWINSFGTYRTDLIEKTVKLPEIPISKTLNTQIGIEYSNFFSYTKDERITYMRNWMDLLANGQLNLPSPSAPGGSNVPNLPRPV